MENKLTPEEEERIASLFKERMELDFKRGSGVTLDKSGYINDRQDEIEKELSQLKTPKPDQSSKSKE